MNKTKKSRKGIIVGIIVAVVIFSLVVTGFVVTAIYNSFLKPEDFVFNAPLSGDGTGYYRHCYNELTDEEKNVYTIILEGIYSQPERIEIPQLGSGDLTRIFEAISYDNPDLFNIGLNCKVYTEGYKTFFETDYILDYADYTAKLQEAKNIASVIINDASVFTSAYEKEKYVHDYLINHCSYVEPEETAMADTMYGCLVEGRASCGGYSRAFQYIMNALNIDNRIVTGESADDGVNYEKHMWNYVVLDGSGYFVDLTWDDPRSEGNVLRHTYFNVTTNDILIKHRDIKQNIPLCTDTKYNFFVYESLYFDIGSGEAFEDMFSNAVHLSVQRQYNCVELRFADAAILEQAKNTLFSEGVVYNVYKEAGLIDGTTSAQVYYSSDSKMNTMCLFF